MPTISASLKIFDQFTAVLSRAEQGMERVLRSSERLHERLSAPLTLSIDAAGATESLNRVRQQLEGNGRESTIGIVLDADSVMQGMTEIQQRMRSQLTDMAVAVSLDVEPAIQAAPTVHNRIVNALGAIEVPVRLQDLGAIPPMSPIEVPVRMDFSSVEAQWEGFRLQVLGKGLPALELNIDSQKVMQELEQAVERVRRRGTVIEIALNAQDILRKVADIQRQIRVELAGSAVAVTLDTSQAFVDAASLRERITQLAGGLNLQVEVVLPEEAELRTRLSTMLQGVNPVVTARLAFDPTAAYADIQETTRRLATSAVTLHVALDASGAIAEVERLKQQIAASGSSAMHIVIDADAVTRTLSQIQNRLRSSGVKIIFDNSTITADAQRVRSLIVSQVGDIEAKIRVQLPASLNVMFADLQRLVRRLLVAIRQLSSTSTNTQQLQNALQRIEALERRIEELSQRHNRNLREGGQASGGLLGNLKGIAAAYVGIQGAQKAAALMNWSDGIASVNSRLGMINDGTLTQLQFQQKVLMVANDTRQAYESTAKMVAQLGASTQGVFKNNQELLSFTSRFNKLLVTGGASAEESSSAILQMTQALGSGVLQGDELRSLSETAPMLMKVLADGLGVSRGSLKKLGADGKLTSDKIVAAFAKQDAYINKLFSRMPVTFGQAMTVAKNKAAEWISQLNGANGPLQNVTKSVMKLIGWLDTDQGQRLLTGLSAGIRVLSGAFAVGTNFLIDHMDIVKNVLLAVGVVVLGLAAYWLVMWAAAAWPVLAVIGGIALLLTVLNRLGVSTSDVVGFVIGLFNALFAVLWNGVASSWNTLLAFAEFFVNLFIDPVYAVKKLFYDLRKNFAEHMYNMLRSAEDFAGGFMRVILDGINGAIGGVNKLLEAISKIPGMGNIKPIETFNADNVHALSDGLKSMIDNMEAPTSDKNVLDFSKYKMSEKSISGAFDTGKQYGLGVFSKTQNALDGLKVKGDAWSNIDKVNEVGKIKDKVDISSEDLKAMRELAEMKNIQNFVTLQPSTTVNVKTGPVSKEADVDSLISKISEHLETAIVTSAEGVYT